MLAPTSPGSSPSLLNLIPILQLPGGGAPTFKPIPDAQKSRRFDYFGPPTKRPRALRHNGQSIKLYVRAGTLQFLTFNLALTSIPMFTKAHSTGWHCSALIILPRDFPIPASSHLHAFSHHPTLAWYVNCTHPRSKSQNGKLPLRDNVNLLRNHRTRTRNP
ncbi:hypothetical protein FB451DRAFT_1234533 [Mycena latifolia]|nr:hypothetical protein FB451DRAFT_1234533 [Mycena latifolia]